MGCPFLTFTSNSCSFSSVFQISKWNVTKMYSLLWDNPRLWLIHCRRQRPICTTPPIWGRATYGDSRPWDGATLALPQFMYGNTTVTWYVCLKCLVKKIKLDILCWKPTSLTYVSGLCTTFSWLTFFQKRSAFQDTSRSIYLYEGVNLKQYELQFSCWNFFLRNGFFS